MPNSLPARRLGYATTCLTCEDTIEADERAYVERGVGAWHEDCYEPRNLNLYRRERDRGKRPNDSKRLLRYGNSA